MIDFHGMPAVRWQSADGATAVATLQGAHLVSWVTAGGEEQLYVSERSPFEPGRAIRGGVPVVFPQFGERGPLAHHGFVRTLPWRMAREVGSGIVFALESTEETRKLWPHRFSLELTITIMDARLDMQLRVYAAGAPLAFNAALHTYLRVSDAAQVRVEGLKGAHFMDRGSTEVQVEARDAVTAADPIDRVYLCPDPVTRVVDGSRSIDITQRGFRDTVVWNPGSERTAAMPDMPPEGWRNMLCVEAAAIEHRIVLPGGGVWAGSQTLDVPR